MPAIASLPRLPGRGASWAADYALLGAISSALAPAGTVLLVGWLAGHVEYALRSFPMTTYCAAAASFGLLTGAAIGLAVRRLVACRAPVLLLLFAVPLVGALWGAAVGGLAGATAYQLGGLESIDDVATSAAMAALVGAFQLGWFWLPHARATRLGRSRRPLLAAAAPLAVAAGTAGWYGWLSLSHAIGAF